MAQFEEGNTIGNRFVSNEEQTEIARKGGRASAEARRQKKSLKNALLALLEMQHRSKGGEVKTGYEVMAVTLFNKAMKGDTKALKLMAELVDEYRQKVEVGNDGRPFELKVVKVSEDMQDKINEYLDGGGLDR